MTESVTGAEAVAAIQDAVAAELARLEQHARKNAKRPPKTPEQRARAAVKARLRTCARGIETLAAELERIHSDKSGYWHHVSLPLLGHRMRGSVYRPGLLDQFERIEREALGGCELSAAFMAEYEELLRLCEHLLHERPPARAPDYDPLAVLTPEQRKWVQGAG